MTMTDYEQRKHHILTARKLLNGEILLSSMAMRSGYHITLANEHRQLARQLREKIHAGQNSKGH